MIDFHAISQACVKCAKCIPHCTIYRIHREEVTSPRGYLDLVGAYARGELTLDSLTKEYFESCFLCTTCVETCPAHLGVDVAIEQIRIDIAKRYGIAWYKRAYFFLLKHRRLMDCVFRVVAFLSPCVFRQGAGGVRVPFSRRVIFPFRKRSFLNTYRGLIPTTQPKTEKLTHHKVAIFIGCLANYNYQQVGTSLLAILDRLGIDALVPKQECCGAPAFFTGDIASVLTLIKRNLTYFEACVDEVDAILIPEATCAAMLLHDWENALKHDTEAEYLLARLERLKGKMAMASAWLYQHTSLASLLDSRKLGEITYHDPCHAKKVLHIHKEPRALLARSYRIVEMSEPDRCCGFGGVSMQADRYALTLKAGRPKAQMIAKTNAPIVSAECSACRMQITNSLAQEQVQASFAHPLELIAKSLESSENLA